MQKSRFALLAGVAIAVALIASGCSAVPTKPSTAASPSPTPVDTSGYIGLQIDPVGTTWIGTDSGGDPSSFTLHDDHSVAVSYANHSFDEPADTWAVVDGVLQLHVFINDSDGTLDYVGQFDPDSGTILASATTSLTGRKITATLTEK